MPGDYYIYEYFDPIRNEPIYIGKGKTNRAYFHLTQYIRKHTKAFSKHRKFYNRINWIFNTGQKPVIHFLIKDISEKEALYLEKQYIKNIGRDDLNEGPLLNLTNGGDGISGYHHTKETKLKLSQLNKGNQYRLGSKLTTDQRKRLSLSHMGHKLSEETKKKLKGSISWNKGKHLSKDIKEKISLSRLKNPCIISQETRNKLKQSAHIFWAKRKESENVLCRPNQTYV